MYQNGTFAPCNKYLARKWHEHQLKKHTHRIRHVKGSLDMSPPKRYPHLEMRLKKIQMEEDRQALVEKHNKLLLHKLTDIMRKPARIDHWNDYQQKRRHSIDVPAYSLNQPARQKALEKIVSENQRLAFKLENAKPIINRKEMEKSFKKHMKVKRMLATGDKDFPTTHQPISYHDYCNRRDGNYSDSWESLSEDEDAGRQRTDRSRSPSPVSEYAGSQDLKTKQDKTGTNRNANVPRFPQIKEKPAKAVKDEKKTQADLDAKQLFRAVKHLADPEETLLKHFAKRSYIQRMQISDKFEYLYDLELGEELKECLGSKYFALIDALLQESNSKSHLETAEKLNTAIETEKIDEVIGVVIAEGKHDLLSLKNVYKREFKHTVEEDVKEYIKNEDIRNLLLVLVQKDVSSTDPDPILAEKDAKELYEGDEDCWYSESGTFLKVVKLRSYMQILLTFETYQDVSDGHAIADTVAAECSEEYATAVSSLGTQIKASNHGKAENLFKAANKPDGGKLFITLLLQASEGDMPAVKQAYREKYKVELTDTIIATFKSQLGRILIEIVHRSGKTATHKKQGPRRLGGMTINPPKQQKPLAKPRQQYAQKDLHHPLNQPVKKKSNATKDANRLDDTYGEADTAVRRFAENEKIIEETPEEEIPDDDCKRIYDAMQGLGIDEDMIGEILTTKNSKERMELKMIYKDRYNQDLLEDLKAELPNNYAELLTGLLTESDRYIIKTIHDELRDETQLIGILCSKTSQRLKVLINKYNEQFKTDLLSDVNRNSSKLLSSLLSSCIDFGVKSRFDEEKAEKDAEEIYEELMEENVDTIAKVLSSHNAEQVKATSNAYENLTGNSIADELEKTFNSSEKSAYVTVLELIENQNDFFADQLHSAIQEVGSKQRFVQTIIQHMDTDLSAIARKYEEKYGESLKSAIGDEINGDYGKMLTRLIQK
ncbi:annexin A6-like isoform X2 [Tubulanus polymorphus]|uniref:annexin A6-like isoform X2 n=1 Tax=Tubulanus polymorphus TaxID=672921 RepID=UPI003DA3F003